MLSLSIISCGMTRATVFIPAKANSESFKCSCFDFDILLKRLEGRTSTMIFLFKVFGIRYNDKT